MNQRRMTFLLVYALLAAAIAVQMGRANWLTYYRLRQGTATTATITQTACADHGTFAYRFAAAGKGFTGSGDGGYGNPPCAALKAGDQVAISYLAAEPGLNVPGDPQGRLFDATLAIATAALFVPLVIIFLLFLLSQRVGKRT